MSCKVHLHSPQGVDMYLDYTCIEVAEHEVARLLARGYTPVSLASNGHRAPATNGQIAPCPGQLSTPVASTKPPSHGHPAPSRNGHHPQASRTQPAPCPKHGAQLERRFKYGEVWFSHAITRADGQVWYCRGQATGKAQDGWEL